MLFLKAIAAIVLLLIFWVDAAGAVPVHISYAAIASNTARIWMAEGSGAFKRHGLYISANVPALLSGSIDLWSATASASSARLPAARQSFLDKTYGLVREYTERVPRVDPRIVPLLLEFDSVKGIEPEGLAAMMFDNSIVDQLIAENLSKSNSANQHRRWESTNMEALT